MLISDVTAREFTVGYISPWDHDKRYYVKPDHQSNVLVTITAEDGTFGWGEAAHAPGIYGETTQASIGGVELLKEALIGQDARNITGLNARLDRVSLAGNIAARAGIDIALHDLLGKLLGVPVYQLLGGAVHDSLLTHQCPPATEELPDYVLKFMAEGYRVFKLKMTGDVDYDAVMVEKLIAVVEGRALLSLDANQGWTVADALRIARVVERQPHFHDNVILEQPIHARDVKGLARLTQSTEARVMADDGIRTLEDLVAILDHRAADIVSIKIQRVGGIQRVKQMVGIAEAYHMPYIIDEINESRLANTAVAHVALASRSPLYTGVASHTHHDLDTIAEGGLTIANGRVSVPDLPGLGITALNI